MSKRWTTGALTALCVIALSGGVRAQAPTAAAAVTVLATPAALVAPAAAPAPPTAKDVNSGDTAWVLVSAAMVMLMTPGLAFFYGGLVRRKNVLSILMQCFMVTCLVSLEWVLMGYSLSFGPDKHGLLGGLEWLGLRGVGAEPCAYAPTIPSHAFVVFQMMFAVITPCLIIGAFAERMKFLAFCAFSLLWSVAVYNPICHWVWGAGGFMGTSGGGWGTLDFAGGIVVHISAGMAALAAALVMGKRQGYPHKISPPHNLPLAVLGAGLLWFGWFGFNAGSALRAGSGAALTFLATHTAGAMAGLTWAVMDALFSRKATMLGMITGVIAGLASVTPAAGYITVAGAVWIGLGAGVICWLSVMMVKSRLNYDDSLDAFGVHGVGGIWGTLATGLFCTKSANASIAFDGLFYGGGGAQFLIQAKAVLVTMVFVFVASLVLFKLVGLVFRLRVEEQNERIGLDLTLHREVGYTLID